MGALRNVLGMLGMPRLVVGKNLTRAQQRDNEQARRGHRPSSRQLFVALAPRALASRPLIQAERAERPGTGGRKFRKGRVMPAVYGKPTFRNVIENGVHR